jgi:DNA adenine methylase
MILNRRGNKEEIAMDVISMFPSHSMYIELFFGAGGIYFNKPKARHNFLNDVDNDVYNLFRQVMERKEELVTAIESVLITEYQFKEWSAGKRETTDLMNAVRFLVLSNYGLYGKAGTLRIGAVNPKAIILSNIDATYDYLKSSYFFNSDFEDAFRKIDYRSNKEKCFCYADPPYLDTVDNYSQSFTEADSMRLFNCLEASEVRWAMSEFDHPFILEQANQRGLIINYIGERKNIMNVRTEILITNYTVPQLKLFQ